MAEGKVAIVTAASKGIGRGCAEALARAGCRLVVCARSADGVDETLEALRAVGAEAEGTVADVSTRDDLERVFALADERFGRLDVLVSNAGGPPPGTLATLTEDDWRTGFELTLMSFVRSLQLAVPRMRAAGAGRVVVIGSSSVRRPLPNLVLSNVFRPAIDGLVKSAAVELAGDGITVNLVAPGRIDTDRVRQLDDGKAEREGTSPDEARAASEASIPIGRYGTPEELGAVVTFLASDAAGYVTGQAIGVDGGLVPTLP